MSTSEAISIPAEAQDYAAAFEALGKLEKEFAAVELDARKSLTLSCSHLPLYKSFPMNRPPTSKIQLTTHPQCAGKNTP
jgi:hypothetical protein